MLVRPRFLPDSSPSKVGIDPGVPANSEGSAVPGGSVFSFGLCDARRLRGFGVEMAGWSTDSAFGCFGASGVWGTAASLEAVLGDVVVNDCFCLLRGGGDLRAEASGLVPEDSKGEGQESVMVHQRRSSKLAGPVHFGMYRR